jgi:hypothetical protein
MNELHAGRRRNASSRYVELAERAEDNSEFVQLVYGYFHRIGGWHGYVYPKENLWDLMLQSFVTGGKGMIHLPWYQFPRAMYWSDLLEENFVHPPFRIMQKGGGYFTEESWTHWFRTIPKESQIVRVNRMTCTDYVQHLRENTWLRWIVGNTDEIERQLLIVPDGKNFRGWDVEFLLPDGSSRGAFVPAKKGRMSRQKTEFLDWNKGNCVCIELSDTVDTFGQGMVHYLRGPTKTDTRFPSDPKADMRS